MSMNPNWPRWIKASVVKWFTDQLVTIPLAALPVQPSLPVYVEEADRSVLRGDTDWCEIRINGPGGRQQSPIDWWLYVDINILVSSIRNEKDAYQIERNNGLVVAAFAANICVFRYGTGIDDDSGYEGTLIGRSDMKSELMISNFGAVPDVRVIQSTIEGRYFGQFQH